MDQHDDAHEKRSKKQRVIHTRVSEAMEEELKEKASVLGVSVSNLVRHVLTNTLDLVEDIVADSTALARGAAVKREVRRDSRHDLGPAPDAPVLAWQRAILNLNAVCGECNDILPRGTEAAIGITDRPGPKPVLCTACMETLYEPHRDEPPED